MADQSEGSCGARGGAVTNPHHPSSAGAGLPQMCRQGVTSSRRSEAPPPNLVSMRKAGGIDDSVWTLPPDGAVRDGRPNRRRRVVVIALLVVVGLCVVYPVLAAGLSGKDYGTLASGRFRIESTTAGGGTTTAVPSKEAPPCSSRKTTRQTHTGPFCRGPSAGARSTPTYIPSVRTRCAQSRPLHPDRRWQVGDIPSQRWPLTHSPAYWDSAWVKQKSTHSKA